MHLHKTELQAHIQWELSLELIQVMTLPIPWPWVASRVRVSDTCDLSSRVVEKCVFMTWVKSFWIEFPFLLFCSSRLKGHPRVMEGLGWTKGCTLHNAYLVYRFHCYRISWWPCPLWMTLKGGWTDSWRTNLSIVTSHEMVLLPGLAAQCHWIPFAGDQWWKRSVPFSPACGFLRSCWWTIARNTRLE